MNKYKTKNIPNNHFYSTKNIIFRELGCGNTVLDIGCNDGYYGKFDKNNIYYGIDYSNEVLKEARGYYKEVLFYNLDNLRKLPWNIKFDIIILADVLEHVLEPGEVLDFFVKNYLEDNGKVIISLPNIANWQIRLNLLFGKFDYTETGIMDKTHLHLYTFKSAKLLVSNNNLLAVKVLEGASILGSIIKIIPFLKYLLATNIIIIGRKIK
ncbi:MAG: methionine biosynthesis protein MetW [Patescibacteria group bacterium]|jgi:2-polyprenyl-3-methyl-5-hydroxy-6-metoxy-1,4-benzoquinol methylase